MKKIGLIIFCLMLTSCFSNRTDSMGEIREIDNLSQLNGTYSNFPLNAHGQFLSTKIFPHITTPVQYIKVEALNNKQLHVEGLDKENNIVVENTFTEGQDFKFSGGEIEIHSHTGVEGFEAQSLALGLSTGTESFAVNSKGDAIYKNHNITGLMVFLIVPVGGSDTRYLQYQKLN